jgi:RNA polymerase sigma-70 factor (sigma-E family)
MAERDARGRDTRWAADEALSEMYAVHWHSLVRLAWLLLHNQQVAEEVVQDAFVSMHSRWNGLAEPDKALAYLRRCVVNGSRSVLRHRAVEQRHLSTELTYSTHDHLAGPSAEEQALERTEGDALLVSLADLPRRQREVLTLRYYLDLSESQIADALDISPGSVKAHAHRGLAALREAMKETS